MKSVTGMKPVNLALFACSAAVLAALSGTSPAAAQSAAGNDFARNSLASPLVQSRAQMRIFAMDDAADAACKERKFTATQLVTAPETNGSGMNLVRKWQEQWTLDRCGQPVHYRVFYTRYGEGGVSLAVANADAPVAVPAPKYEPPAPVRILSVSKPFMKGDDVLAVQKALLTAGIEVGTDGIYGPGTRKAVLAFQAKNGLTPDGDVGPATRSALGL